MCGGGRVPPQVAVKLRGRGVGAVAAQRAAGGAEDAVLHPHLVVARRGQRGGGHDEGGGAAGGGGDGGGRWLEGQEGGGRARREPVGRAAEEGLAGKVVVDVVAVPPLRRARRGPGLSGVFPAKGRTWERKLGLLPKFRLLFRTASSLHEWFDFIRGFRPGCNVPDQQQQTPPRR